MNCPKCQAATRVLDTRGIIRRRVCIENPDHRFETKETVSFVGLRRQGRPLGIKNQLARWDGLE